MKGRSPIVLVLSNHSFYEHPDEESAIREAERLSERTGREAVVYVPVVAVQPPRPRMTQRLGYFEKDDLPF